MIVCLLLNMQRDVWQFMNELQALTQTHSMKFQEAEATEWSIVVSEIVAFLKVTVCGLQLKQIQWLLLLLVHEPCLLSQLQLVTGRPSLDTYLYEKRRRMTSMSVCLPLNPPELTNRRSKDWYRGSRQTLDPLTPLNWRLRWRNG